MKRESLPHLPQSLDRAYDAILSKDYKLLQVSTPQRLGVQLMDLAIKTLKKEEKVTLLISDSITLDAFVHRAKEIGLNVKVNTHGHICLEWSDEIYPSQKTLALGSVFPQLNRKIDGKSLLQILVSSALTKALPDTESLSKTPLDSELLSTVRQAYSVYNPIVDYSKIEQLVLVEELDFVALSEEIESITKSLDSTLNVLQSVDKTFEDPQALRRLNHSSTHPLIQKLYSVYTDLDDVLNGLTQVAKVPMKRPLNAAMLTAYLHGQVITWYHRCELLTSALVIDWLRVMKELPWDIASSLWVLAKYKVKSPWPDVIVRQRAEQDLFHLEYHSSRVKFDDCQHFLRVLIGNIEERLMLVTDVSQLNSNNSTLTILPHHLSKDVSNPLGYEIISTTDDLPLLKNLYTGGRLNDSQLLSNANSISMLLVNRVPMLQVYLSKANIILSSLHYLDKEVSQILSRNGYDKIEKSNVEENLKECLIDVNRKVYILILGSFLAIDNLSDWVYQVQLLEHLESTGIEVIDVPIHIANGSQVNIRQSIAKILGQYVEG